MVMRMPTFDELVAKLSKADEINKYFDNQGLYITDSGVTGYTVINVLSFLVGMPLCDLVLAYMPAVNAERLRIIPHNGMMTSDAIHGRVTIILDENKLIKKIELETDVGYGCGHDINAAFKKITGKGIYD